MRALAVVAAVALPAYLARQTPAELEAREKELLDQAKADADGQGKAVIVQPKTAKKDTEGAIGKVVTLLEDLKQKVTDDNDRDGRMWDKFACFCREEKTQRGADIEAAKARLVELTKSIGTEQSLIEEAKLQIKFEVSNIAQEYKKQDQLNSMMGRDDEDFLKRKGQNTETLNVLSGAIGVLADKKSFLQVQAPVKKALALLEQMTGKSVNNGGMGQALGYLVDLKKQTAVDLQQDTSENMNAKKVHNKEMLLSMQAVAQHEAIKARQEAILAEEMKKLGEDTEEYTQTKEKLDSDAEFFTNLSEDCAERERFYGVQVQDAQAEMDAIDAALPILRSIVDGTNTAGASTFFIQTRMFANLTLKQHVDGVTDSIAKMTQDMRPRMMSLLNTAATADVAGGAVEKIVKACQKMIGELKDEIKDTQKNKATCIKETQRLTMAHIEAKRELKAAEDKLAAEQQQLEFLGYEVKKVIGDMALNQKAYEDLKAQCTATESTLRDQKAEIEAELTALTSAIEAISAAYGPDAMAALKDHKTHKADYNNKFNEMASDNSAKDQETDFTDQSARRGGGAKIVSMLLMIKGDLQKNLDDTDAEKTQSAQECVLQQAELIKLKGTMSKLKVTKRKAETASAKQKAKDQKLVDDETNEEAAAETELGDYGNCAQKIGTYNNAISAKQTDIEGLNAVINHLNSMADGTEEAVSAADLGLLSVE